MKKNPPKAVVRSPQSRRAGRSTWAWLALLLFGALLVRLPGIHESLWSDEVWYSSTFLDTGLLDKVLTRDVHPPLYALVMKAWIAVFGDSEVALRLPPLFFGLASIVVLFLLADAWLGRRTAWIASSLAAFSPVHIWYSHENKNNILLLLLVLLTMYLLPRAWQSGKARDWAWFSMCAIAALWTNVFAAFIVLAAFLWLYLQAARQRGGSGWKWVAASNLVVVGAWTPFLAMAFSRLGKLGGEYLRPFDLSACYHLFLVYLPHGNTLRTISPYASLGGLFRQPWPYFFVDLLYAVLIAMGIWRAARLAFKAGAAADAGQSPHELLLLWVAVPPAAAMAASFLMPRLYTERSMIILLPAVALLTALAVASPPRPLLQAVLGALLAAFAIAALLNLLVFKTDVWTVYKHNPDWRSASGYLVTKLAETEEPIFIVQHTDDETLPYYYARFLRSRTGKGRRPLPASLPLGRMVKFDSQRLRQFVSEYRIRRIFLVHDLYWTEQFEEVLAGFRDASFLRETGTAGFRGIQIHTFEVSEPGGSR